MLAHGYESTRLWSEAFGAVADTKKHYSDRLAASYRSFYDRAAVLAGEIPRDLAEYTVHDVTHLNGVWSVADMLADESLILNPLEAYVLGGAILTHDLGMSAAAYVNGYVDLESTAAFSEAISVLFGPGRNSSDLSSEEVRTARAWTLRENHAEQAANLPTQGWQHAPSKTTVYLIEDADLRISLGPAIGRLAQSHWWSISKVNEVFVNEMGAPAGFPREWTIDLFKLAVLLRAADAAQIDSLRAPTFLFSLRHLSGLSEKHWRFQNRLNAPKVRKERLQYDASEPFNRDDADSWWLCFDAGSMIHRELQDIDSYLSGRGSAARLTARGVAGANDPVEFSKWVHVEGWVPVDARPTITDVTNLITKLGGDALYGKDELVPIRELLQNALDASEALGAIDEAFRSRLAVAISVQENEGVLTLSVSDSGVGMSKDVLLYALLDFGSSIWKSTILRREFPQLIRKKLNVSGRFGIGFFSVFMIGDRIKVSTRRYDAGPNDTMVLEFTSGLRARPLLRVADAKERLWSSGTIVSVEMAAPITYPFAMHEWLCADFSDRAGDTPEEERFPLVCQYLVPLPLISYSAAYGSATPVQVSGVDWRTISADELFRRIVPAMTVLARDIRAAKAFVNAIRPIIDHDGQMIGRAAIVPWRDTNFYLGAVVITDAGVRLGVIQGTVGVFLGDPIRAARDASRVRASKEVLAKWASEQADIYGSRTDADDAMKLIIADRIVALDGDPGVLPIARCRTGYLNQVNLRSWIAEREYFVIADDSREDDDVDPYEIGDHVLVTNSGLSGIREALHTAVSSQNGIRYFTNDEADYTLTKAIERVAAGAWRLTQDGLLEIARGVKRGDRIQSEIGLRSTSRLPTIQKYTRAYRCGSPCNLPSHMAQPVLKKDL